MPKLGLMKRVTVFKVSLGSGVGASYNSLWRRDFGKLLSTQCRCNVIKRRWVTRDISTYTNTAAHRASNSNNDEVPRELRPHAQKAFPYPSTDLLVTSYFRQHVVGFAVRYCIEQA